MTLHPALLSAASLYLVAAGTAAYAWLAWPALPLPWYAAPLCALPLLVYVLAALTSANLDRLAVRTLACIGMGPILLLMWAASYEPAPAPEPAPDEYATFEPGVLFAGALSVQEAPIAATGGVRISAAQFADGSELHLMQLPSAEVAAGQLANLAIAFDAKPSTLAGRAGLRGQAAELILWWEQHDRTLLELRARDEVSAAARLAAQRVPLPPSSPAPAAKAPPEARVVWPFATGYAVAHALLFCLFVLWAGAAITRVARVPGAAWVPLTRLRARLSSLQHAGARLRLGPEGSAHELVLHLPTAAQRSHRLILYVDEQTRMVRVRELEGAGGAAPRDDAEADMRGLGEIGLDPTRPKARAVWGSTIQTSLIDPKRLAALDTRFEGDDVQLAEASIAAFDATALIHLTCAVVTRSGFDWQPVFLLWQG